MVLPLLALLLSGARGAAVNPLQFALNPPADLLAEGALVSRPPRFISEDVQGGVFFPDGTLLYGARSWVHHIAGDATAFYETRSLSPTTMAPHPDGSIIVASYSDDALAKYSSTGSSLVEDALVYDTSVCVGPNTLAIQRTGNRRIFVLCEDAAELCQYDSDISNRDCTALSVTMGLVIAPDDSFLVLRDADNLRKYTINDGAGTLTAGPTLDVSGASSSTVWSMAILSDHRIVLPDLDNDQLEVVNAAFTTVEATIDVNSGSLGGISPSCNGPAQVVTDWAGTGDLFVACAVSGSLLILSNDLSTTALELLPGDLDRYGPSFEFDIQHSEQPLSIADLPGRRLFVGGGDSALHGFVVFDIGGAGTLGLAGSYGTVNATLPDSLGYVAIAGHEVVKLDDPTGAVVFADGTLAIANQDLETLVLLDATYTMILDVIYDIDLGQLALHPDGSAIGVSFYDNKLHKITSSSSVLTETASDSSAECVGPSRVVFQKTGNQRIFAICKESPDAFCQWDADLTNRDCTSLSSARGIAVSPDDSYLVVRDGTTLQKYTINDGPGTLTAGATFDISGGTSSSVYSLVILSDDRIVVPDKDGDQIEIVNAAFDGLETPIDVASGSFGGINPTCEGPEDVAVDPTGTGDVFVACDGSDSLLIISNDLSTTAFQSDLLIVQQSEFSVTVSDRTSKLSVANPGATLMFVGGSKGFHLMDMTGGGTAGLAGSYATSVVAMMDEDDDGLVLGSPALHPRLWYPQGLVNFGDSTVALLNNALSTVLLTSADFETLYDWVQLDESAMMLAHPDGTAVVLDYNTHTVHKYSSTGSALVEEATWVDTLECERPFRVVVQQTGNQRIFFICEDTASFCQLDADLTSPDCTTVTLPLVIGIAPDDSFIVIRDNIFLRKYTINDGAGTLTAGATLDISGTTTDFTTFSIAVMADERMVLVDPSLHALVVVNSAFDGLSTVDTNNAVAMLGGIIATCDYPSEVGVAPSGLGEIVVYCDGTDDFLTLSNDLTTTATMIKESDLGIERSLSLFVARYAVTFSFLPTGEVFLAGEYSFAITGTSPLPGAAGDPVITDLAGHRFIVGTEPNTEYALLVSPDETERVSFTTSTIRGIRHHDYFIQSVHVARAGCGKVTVTADNASRATSVESDDPCMGLRAVKGDNGLVAISIGDGSVVAVVIPHHGHGESFSFLNIKLAGDVAALRGRGYSGVLADERHAV